MPGIGSEGASPSPVLHRTSIRSFYLMTFRRIGGGTTETDRRVRLPAAVDIEVGAVASHQARDQIHLRGPGPASHDARGSFNASQRRELDCCEADRPGLTLSGTGGKSSGREKFNGERPARACW